MSRFYVTTPIYYVNDVPHIGHAYTTVAGRRPHPLAPPARRRRLLPHRHRRARPQDPAGGRGAGPRARASSWRSVAGVFREEWDAARHRLRRLHPHDRAAPPQGGAGVPAAHLRRRRHRARPLRGSLLRLVRGVLHRRRARRRQLPDPRSPGRARDEENYFFKLSRYERPAARVLRRASRSGAARARAATRCSGSSAAGCRTSRSAARRSRGACRCRGTRSTSPTCGSTRSFNYCTAVGFGDDGERFAKWWPVDYHLIGKDILRLHASTGRRC